jgi:hypothetical protein
LSRAQGELVAELLTESLASWQVAGRVVQDDDGGIVVSGNSKSIRIDPAPPEQQDIFRWLIATDGRQRPAVSVVAILRQVRQALDPGYAASRVRVTVAPLVPPP